jgi:IS4 transposase
MTNLPRAAWSAEQVMSLYRCRWQVELLFKEWKLHNRRKGFVTGEKVIAEGLVWTSLLSLVMKRRVVQSVMAGKLSMLKASKNSTTWWLPLLDAVADMAPT